MGRPSLWLAGEKYGRWTVRSLTRTHPRAWLCQCDCGTEKVVAQASLRGGGSTSCGCYRDEKIREALCKEERRRDQPEWRVWHNMVRRCTDPNLSHYKHYGGRGIRVCERWNNYANFIADMGHRPTPTHSLDRIDNDGDYEPSNCRWATPEEQVRNRSDNVWVEFDGRRRKLIELCDKYGIKPRLVRDRMRKYGWPLEKALTTPVVSRANRWKYRGIRGGNRLELLEISPENPTGDRRD